LVNWFVAIDLPTQCQHHRFAYVRRELGITQNRYKTFDRYREHGLAALSDRSRRSAFLEDLSACWEKHGVEAPLAAAHLRSASGPKSLPAALARSPFSRPPAVGRIRFRSSCSRIWRARRFLSRLFKRVIADTLHGDER
jgi:hypothetical protein